MSSSTPQTRLAQAMRLMLLAMPVGLEVQTINLLGRVKRHGRSTWVLFQDGITSRSRWGNLEQMTEDLVYFETYSTLPEPEKIAGF